MRFSLRIIYLGWCLISQKWTTGGQFLPKPSITVSPSAVVLVGENATIRCKSEESYQPTEFTLYKKESVFWPYMSMKTVERDEALFHIIHVKPSDAGTYQCVFLSVYYEELSDYSDEVHIKIKDPHLAKPLIQMEPKGPHVLSANVAIHCQGPEKGLTFLLYRSMDLVASQIAKPESNTTTFSIFAVKPENAGSYTCQYHAKENPFVWSEPSVSMKLVVKDPRLGNPLIKMEPKGPHDLGANVTIHCQGPEKVRAEDAGNYTCQYQDKGNPFLWSEPTVPMNLVVKDRFSRTTWAGVAAGSLLVVLLLLFLFILYRKRRKGSTANDRNQPVNVPQEAEAGEDPSEVSYAVLNLNSHAADVSSNPESCVYAVVARNSIRKGP